MTHPDIEIVEQVEPIPVRPVPTVKTTDADLCAWQTFTFAGTEDAQPLLPYDKKRHKARIYIQGAAANSVQLGAQGQMASAQGGRFFPPNIVEYTAAAALWIRANNGAITVTIQDERYNN